MVYTADGYFGIGEVVSPLAVSTGNSLLKDADPVLFNFLAYLSGVINLHVKARWNQEVVAAGLSDLTNKPVAYKLPFDPLPFMQETHFKFPLLAIYRKSESYQNKTTAWYTVTSSLEILWAMPPVNSGQLERLNPFRVHVARTMMDRLLMGYDTNWNNGQHVLQDSGVEKIEVLSTQFGSIPDLRTEDKFFPSILMQINVSERRSLVEGHFEPFEGITTSIDEGSTPDQTVSDFIVATTDLEQEE